LKTLFEKRVFKLSQKLLLKIILFLLEKFLKECRGNFFQKVSFA